MGLSEPLNGTLQRRLRLIRRVLVLSVVLVCSAYLGELCFMRYRCARAVRLIESVRKFKIGVTSSEEVRQLSERYGGEFHPAQSTNVPLTNAQSYVLTVWSPYVLIRGNALPMPGPGLRIWGVMAMLYIEDGHLAEVHLMVAVRRSDGLDLSSNVEVRKNLMVGPEGATYYVVEPHVTGPPTEALRAEVSPGASSEERRKAFDFNTNCLTSFRECRHVCEVSPGAWKDLGEHRLRDGDGQEKAVDAECNQSLSGTK